MALLKREDFLKQDDFKIEKVDLGNGDFVYVKEMSAKAKEDYQRSLMEVTFDDNGKPKTKQKTEDLNAKLAVCTMCDKDGNLIMKPNDAHKLSEYMKASKLEKIVDASTKINAMNVDAVENEVKN